jgi:hypothetical protein
MTTAIKRLNEVTDEREKMIYAILYSDKYRHLPDHKFNAKEKQLMKTSFVNLKNQYSLIK